MSALSMALGAGFSLAGTAVSYEMEAAEAQRVRDWQEKMSNTAIQRRVEDMRDAGINPLLAVGAGGGASTPPGAMARASAPNVAGGAVAGLSSAKWAKEKHLLNKQIETESQRAQLVVNQSDAAAFAGQLSGRQEELVREQVAQLKTHMPGLKIEQQIDEGPSGWITRNAMRYAPFVPGLGAISRARKGPRRGKKK